MQARTCLTSWAIVVLGAITVAQPAEAREAVRTSLVAESDRFEPGETVAIGVLFELDPGWHIYWRNPGDAGLATEVLIELPDEYRVGEMQWPVPTRFTQPGDLVGFGYEGSVLLAAEVELGGAEAAAGTQVAVSTSWLACKDVCVLGSAEMTGRLPLTPAPELFRSWRSRLPRTEPPFDLTISRGLAHGDRRGKVSLWLKWQEPPGTVDFFADGGAHLKIVGTRVLTRGDLTRVDLEATAVGGGAAELRTVPAVVTASRPGGARSGWRIDAPIFNNANTTFE